MTSPSVTPAPAMSATSDREPIRIVPKGLRSFDAGDSDFFLELLPGPRDRNGLPNSLRFWESRIEETDPDATFSVGLIYGPSGCGKSSLIKAGLLPRLSANVAPVYIEATAHDTEARLLAGLQRRFPELRRDDWSLVETLSALRKGYALPRGQKALIVIDQFEQWLHAHGDEGQAALIFALRQCDGARLQCIITVRDDFWLAVSRFLRDLEVRLVEGHNSALADLFEPDHARRVLGAFGRAFGKLPEHAVDTGKDAKEFLRQAVEGLSEEHKVNCARLALFAEMMKGKDWTPAALKAVGGTSGVGVTFLEETFSASTAPPAHRVHQKAARTVLHALLPESGSDIKGAMRSHDELFAASKYVDPRDFEELLRILDGELRLITPTDPQGSADLESTANGARPGQKYYQLTHDYLVPSLRDWLTRKQKETREGRAALALADRASVWNARPENRQLPSLWQWLSFRRWTDKSSWTEPQRKMMRRAGRVHSWRVGVTAVLLVALGLFGWDRFGRNRAETLYKDLMAYDLSHAQRTIEKAAFVQHWLGPRLRGTINDPNSSEADRLRARLALLPDDPSQLPFVYPEFLKCDPQDVDGFRQLLVPGGAALLDDLWTVAKDHKKEPGARLRAACALAKFDPDNSAGWREIRDDIAAFLVAQADSTRIYWIEALKLVGSNLTGSLGQLMQEEDRGEEGRAVATDIFAIYSQQVPIRLTELVSGIGHTNSDATKEERIADAKRRANLGVALVQMQRTDLAQPLLDKNQDPTARSFLIERLSRKRIPPATLFDAIQDSAKPPAARLALILACGDIPLTQISKREGDALVAYMEQLCRSERDGGVRGAAEWALRSWRRAENLPQIDSQLMERDREVAKTGQLPANQKWFVNSQKEMMVVVEPGELVIEGQGQHRTIKVDRRFAIASKEVTARFFRQFLQEEHLAANVAGDGDQPIINVTWYEAAHFCNWLSKKDEIDHKQFCYEENDLHTFADGMSIKSNADDLIGYRLSKVLEWEFAYRAGTTVTRFSFGDAESLAEHYAWFSSNSEGRVHSGGMKKPNLFGLFDMDGNASEWCHDRFDRNPKKLAIHDYDSLSLRQNCYSRGYEALGAAKVGSLSPLGERFEDGQRIVFLGSCGFRVVRVIR
jgi:formylglycine-generating enzyme required for sulfatase activity